MSGIANNRTPFMIFLLVLMVVSVLRSAVPDKQDPTNSDPYATIIEFSIPGSVKDVTSKAIVVVPRDYVESLRGDDKCQLKRYPVVYLLHGYSGNYTNWYVKSHDTGKPLSILADRHKVILVMPDGKYSSWYLNAEKELADAENWQWETVITRFLIPEIDKRYRTWTEPAGRGIIGLSMGGHGALYLTARHPELFSACGAMSGVMDLRNTAKKHGLEKHLGSMDQYANRFLEHSVITQARKFVGRKVGIIIDCGREDVFFTDNQLLHDKLIKLAVPHDYIERPGAHTWPYWINALPYHIQFLADRLKKAGHVK